MELADTKDRCSHHVRRSHQSPMVRLLIMVPNNFWWYFIPYSDGSHISARLVKVPWPAMMSDIVEITVFCHFRSKRRHFWRRCFQNQQTKLKFDIKETKEGWISTLVVRERCLQWSNAPPPLSYDQKLHNMSKYLLLPNLLYSSQDFKCKHLNYTV